MNPTDLMFAMEMPYVWVQMTPAGKAIIGILAVASVFVWSVLGAKAMQMRKAARLNDIFEDQFRKQRSVLEIYDRQPVVEGCPMFSVYSIGCLDLDGRLRKSLEEPRRQVLGIKSLEHVKNTIEREVAHESLNLESGLILLAVAVSGAPFLGLLGTVWGVMSVFSEVAQVGTADLPTMAPGLSAAMATTVAGLLVAIPSMFGYNYLVHKLRVQTVRLDNFALELASRLEAQFLEEAGHEAAGPIAREDIRTQE